MKLEYLEKEQGLIEEYIKRFGSDGHAEKAESVYDGVLDCKKYLESAYRICWVLKEPCHKGDEKFGGRSLTGNILARNELYPGVVGNSPAWQPMAYVAYSLLNGFEPYNSMDYISDDSKMAQSLNGIALINVNKMPANNRLNNNDIAEKYEYWKPILFWQLRQYDPHIIIFENTFKYFQEDLGIENREKRHEGHVDYVIKNNKIYLDAYHPAQTDIIRDVYIQNIINIVKTNIGKIEKSIDELTVFEIKTITGLPGRGWNDIHEISECLEIPESIVKIILEHKVVQ
jgi:hypothetical protein